MDILATNAKDPDPLTQLRLLIANTEWKVPETLLVPKDRLNAVLASPAREIPLLLTTRPELRLPGAFAFPSILQDPDILVVSLAQLEAILEKQQEIFKLKANTAAPKRDQEIKQKPPPPAPVNPKPQQHVSDHNQKQQQENLMHQQIQRALSNKMGSQTAAQQQASQKGPSATTHNLPGVNVPGGAQGLANEIDAATIAAFNQMLWLPYLNQMRGQLTPDVIKAVAGFNEMLPLLAAQSRIQQGLMAGQQNNHNSGAGGGGGASAGATNSLEFAMWQEAMLNANNANLRNLIKNQQQAAEFTKKQQQQQQQLEQRKAANSVAAAAAQFTTPGKINKQHHVDHQQHQQQHLPNPLSPLAIPPFVPPAVAMQGSSRLFNPILAAANHQANNRSPMPSPTNPLHSPFSPTYRQQQLAIQQQQQQQHQQRTNRGHRYNPFSPTGGGQGPSIQQQQQLMKKAGALAMPPNQFFPFGQTTPSAQSEFDEQMSLLATKKAQKELEQVLQLQQQEQQQRQQAKYAQEQKLNKLTLMQQQQQQMNSFLNSAKMSLHHHQQQQQQQMFNQQMLNQLNELSKLSSLMAMPSAFDSPLNAAANPLMAAAAAAQQSAAAAAVNQEQQQQHQHQQEAGGSGGSGGGGQQPKLKLKVKPGMHLLDPMAMQRRLLTHHSDSSDEMSAEMVSTTSHSGMDTSSPDINSPLWHPLFGNR